MRFPLCLILAVLMLVFFLVPAPVDAGGGCYGGGVPASGLMFAPSYATGGCGVGVPASAPVVMQAPAYGYGVGVQAAPVIVRQRAVIRQRAFVPGYGVGAGVGCGVGASPVIGAVPVGAGGINVNVNSGNVGRRRGLFLRR